MKTMLLSRDLMVLHEVVRKLWVEEFLEIFTQYTCKKNLAVRTTLKGLAFFLFVEDTLPIFLSCGNASVVNCPLNIILRGYSFSCSILFLHVVHIILFPVSSAHSFASLSTTPLSSPALFRPLNWWDTLWLTYTSWDGFDEVHGSPA